MPSRQICVIPTAEPSATSLGKTLLPLPSSQKVNAIQHQDLSGRIRTPPLSLILISVYIASLQIGLCCWSTGSPTYRLSNLMPYEEILWLDPVGVRC